MRLAPLAWGRAQNYSATQRNLLSCPAPVRMYQREGEREGEDQATAQRGLDKYGHGTGVSKKEKVDTADMSLLNILDKEILVRP